MKLLLDTHTLLWVLEDTHRLSTRAAQALNDPDDEKLASLASFWEMAIKVGIGKLTMRTPPEEVLDEFDRENIATCASGGLCPNTIATLSTVCSWRKYWPTI